MLALCIPSKASLTEPYTAMMATAILLQIQKQRIDPIPTVPFAVVNLHTELFLTFSEFFHVLYRMSFNLYLGNIGVEDEEEKFPS